MQINAYTVSLFVAALISAGLSYYAWKRRSVTAGAELAALMLAVALWALFQGMEGIATTRALKMFWSATAYLGSQTTPVLLLLFALRYTRKGAWITARRIALLLVVPVASIAIAYTSGIQGVLWRKVTLTHTVAGTTAVYSHGPWYWIELAYGYALVAIALVLLVQAVIKMPGVYSWQARILILATLLPFVGHIIYSFSPSSVQGLDITPIFFTLTGILVALALFRYHLLDLRPIASGVLYESIGDAMAAIDTEGRVLDINAAGMKLVGGLEGSVVGSRVEEAFGSVPGLPEKLADGGQAPPGDLMLDADGHQVYLRVRVWPLSDRRDRPLGKLVMLQDVTDIREAQEELKRINTELDLYAHTVSHDLKGPLAALHTAGEALERLVGMPETEQRNANVVKVADILVRNTRKADELVNGLLSLAVAGQKPVDVNDIRIDKVVRRVVEERRGEVEAKGIRVVYSGLGTVRADRTHVYQLFANLIGNSIKHNTSAEPVVEVRLLESSGGLHRYLVRDNGKGVPPDDLDRIFDPFYEAGEGGSGVGLATVARIVQVYGGGITAYNDNGACFEFTLRDYTPNNAT
ncbi:MAG: histidine kinase N-terminal 7TM domain-containing protein [Candidatus Geothermincolia bacterium]